MFIDEVISNGDFIAIHWRYDKDDWLAANCKEGVSEFMQTKCNQIHEVSFVFVSTTDPIRKGLFKKNRFD